MGVSALPMLYIVSSSSGQVSQHPNARGKGYPCTSCTKTLKINHTIMKKTLIALMALASLSYGTTTDATFTQSTSSGQAGYSGFTFNLSEDWLTLAPSNLDLTDYTEFNLESVALTSAATWYNLANNASGLVILDSTNTVVGKSWWNNTGATYTFDSLTLSVNQDYTAIFYGNKTAYDI